MFAVSFVNTMSWARALRIEDRSARHLNGALIRSFASTLNFSRNQISVHMDVSHPLLAEVGLATLESQRAELALDLRVKKHLPIGTLGLRTSCADRCLYRGHTAMLAVGSTLMAVWPTLMTGVTMTALMAVLTTALLLLSAAPAATTLTVPATVPVSAPALALAARTTPLTRLTLPALRDDRRSATFRKRRRLRGFE